jgi:hypothetical protein
MIARIGVGIVSAVSQALTGPAFVGYLLVAEK